jgi:uncharacterized coiled-coil DUF342 family protein
MSIFSKKKSVKKKKVAKSAVKNSDKELVKIEELTAKLQVMEEERKVVNDKFSRVHEQIGEMRATAVETEKGIQDLVVKAEQAASLVQEVQPEKLMMEVKKLQVTIEGLQGKTDLNQEVSKNIVKQIKDMNKAVKAYRGVAQVAKQTDKLREELQEIRKIERKAELHADKVEKRYMKFSDQYLDFKRHKAIISEARKLEHEANKLISNQKFDMEQFATKDELVNSENTLRSQIEYITGYHEGGGKLGAFRHMFSKAKDSVDPAPMPMLFSLDPTKKSYVTFKFDKQKHRFYLDIEQMVEEQVQEAEKEIPRIVEEPQNGDEVPEPTKKSKRKAKKAAKKAKKKKAKAAKKKVVKKRATKKKKK